MKDVKMRNLVNAQLEELEALEQIKYNLICDNGSVEVIKEEIIFSWFLWGYHRKYPKTPCLVEHVYNNKPLTQTTHLDYLGVIQKDCYMTNRSNAFESLLPYNKVGYRCYNELYNYIVGNLTHYMTGISILDYIEVMNHPEIKEVNEGIKNKRVVTPRDIFDAGGLITHILDTDETLSDNPLSVAFKHRLVSINQILQCIGPRGFVSDVDAHIFGKPIRTGFAEGIKELADYIAESRTGTMAEIMTGEPMKDSEYLNRLLQLSVSRVKRLHRTDCGTTRFFDWFVDSDKKLKDLKGKYFLDPETQKQVAIDPKKHKHLVGKTIKLRSVFSCQHEDREGVCAMCFGELSYNIINTDNIGHISAIEFQSDQSQLILGFKHVTGSASEYGIYICDTAKLLFDLHPETHRITTNQGFISKGLMMRVPYTSFRGFETLNRIDSWEQVSPVRISRITTLEFFTGDNAPLETIVGVKENPVHFSMEALKFLKDCPHTVEDDGSYVFDLTGFKASTTMFNIPKVQFDMLSYAKSLEAFIKGPSTTEKTEQQTIRDFTDPIHALTALHDLVSQRLSIALPHIEIVLLSCCCEDPSNNDYRLPKNKYLGKFASHTTIMRNSSAGIALGYQKQEDDIFNPLFYLDQPRPDHQYDYLILGGDGL